MYVILFAHARLVAAPIVLIRHAGAVHEKIFEPPRAPRISCAINAEMARSYAALKDLGMVVRDGNFSNSPLL